MLGDENKLWFHVFQVIGIVGAILTLVVIFNAVKAWLGGYYRIWGKLLATVLVFACFGYLWFALASNLLIPRMTY
jgi:hypothetical protein